MMEHVMIRSGHVDSFARDNLPPRDQWPEFKFTLPELQYPDQLNCVTEFVDRWVAGGVSCFDWCWPTIWYTGLPRSSVHL